MYATVADFVLARGSYMHWPGSHHSVQFQAHHLVTWKAFHASPWSQHYYGQVRVSWVANIGNATHVLQARPARHNMPFLERALGTRVPCLPLKNLHWGALQKLRPQAVLPVALGCFFAQSTPATQPSLLHACTWERPYAA